MANGFEVTNLSGGIKAYQNGTAIGDETLGLSLFSGSESPADILVVAYSLELGLEDFYLEMANRSQNSQVKDLFEQLSTIEILHRDSILALYQSISGLEIDHEVMRSKLVTDIAEGGLSTMEYLKLFHPDLDSPTEVIGLAMSIEAQALDLYERASRQLQDDSCKSALAQIASEEKVHLQQLGKLMENIS